MITDRLTEVRQALAQSPTRTVLTGIAVAWGVFILISLLGISDSVYADMTSDENRTQSNIIKLWPGYTTKAHKGYNEARYIELKAADVELVSQRSTLIEHVEPHIAVDSSRITTSLDYINASVYGHFPSELIAAKLKMVAGRFLNERDMLQKRKVIVLNEQSASTLFRDSADKCIGKTIDMMGLAWVVIGVYSHEWEKGSYVPYTTAVSLRDNDSPSELNIKLSSSATDIVAAQQAELDIRTTLAAQHHFNPSDKGALYIWNRLEGYFKQQEAFSIMRWVIWVIGLLTLLTGIVGVGNIMLVSVCERINEFGIRRALGATPFDICLQVVIESAIITTSFGAIGICAGTALLASASLISPALGSPHPNMSTAVEVLAVLALAGIIAGLLPAYRSTKLSVITAINYK